MILGLGLAGILGLTFVIFFALGTLVRDRNAGATRCRQALLQTQDQVARELNALLRLNPRARALEKERRRLLAQRLMASNPATLAAVEARLRAVRTQQTLLGLQQTALVSAMETASRALPLRLTQSPPTPDGRWRRSRVSPGFVDDEVAPVDRSHTAPEYRVVHSSDAFFRSIEVEIVSGRNNDDSDATGPSWVRPSVVVRCASRLIERGSSWRSVLAPARSPSNRS
jgi:hypothetical protein